MHGGEGGFGLPEHQALLAEVVLVVVPFLIDERAQALKCAVVWLANNLHQRGQKRSSVGALRTVNQSIGLREAVCCSKSLFESILHLVEPVCLYKGGEIRLWRVLLLQQFKCLITNFGVAVLHCPIVHIKRNPGKSLVILCRLKATLDFVFPIHVLLLFLLAAATKHIKVYTSVACQCGQVSLVLGTAIVVELWQRLRAPPKDVLALV